MKNCFITGRMRELHTCRCYFYSGADFWVFRPAGASRCTDQGEIHLDRLKGVGIYGPQNLKIGIKGGSLA